jgi:pyridoxine 5-phosphate synthase
MKRARLGVNIDHVATLRKQRDENYPDVARAAKEVLLAGAEQITIHLREDRRHIHDKDLLPVQKVCQELGKLLNLEMGATSEMNQIACQLKPDWVCLVPESREEKTTEGGLNLKDLRVYEKVKNTIFELKSKSPQTKVSLFLEANQEILSKVPSLAAHAVEIHTGSYAHDFLRQKTLKPHLESYQAAQAYLKSVKIACHAGHGLTDLSVRPLVEQEYFEEYNIGHWIVSEALFSGLGEVVKRLIKSLEK